MHITINLRSAGLAFLLPLIFTPQSGLLAQVTAPNQCVATPDFPAGSVCPIGEIPITVFTENFDSGFGVFSEEPQPVGANDLTVSTNGDTPSSGTGPETTASCSGNTNEGEFIFLEGSFTLPGEVHCMSTTLDLNALSAPLTLSFWYHMFGDNIGELAVNVDGTNEFSVTGQQQTANGQSWLQGTVDLSSHAGSSVPLQICMSEGNGSVSTFESDISIDHIQVSNGCTPAGQLEVVKTLLPSTDSGRFDLLIDGNTKLDGTGDTATTGELDLLPGVHTVAETADSGSDLNDYTTTIECRDSDGSGAVVASSSDTGPLNVTVNENDDIVCTITNTRKGSISITKQTLPASATGSFDFSGDLGNFVLQANGSTIFMDLPAGSTYTISETDPSGFELTAIDCDDLSSITPSTVDIPSRTATVELDPAESVSCTFTNQQFAQLSISVDLLDPVPGAGFDFTTSGLTPASFTLQPGETQTFTDLVPNQTYTVNEQLPLNWELEEVICSEAPPVCETGSVIVTPEPGQSIDATFRIRLASRIGLAEATRDIPTLSWWGLASLIGLFSLALMWRRQTQS